MNLISEPIVDLAIQSHVNQLLTNLTLETINKFEHIDYEKSWRRWISSSTYNPVIGLDEFQHSAYISGTTNAFPEFIARYPGKRVRASRSDFVLTKILCKAQNRQYLPLEEGPLEPNDLVIFSHPYSGNGNTLPNYNDILNISDHLGIPVMVDACYFGVSYGISYDLTHPCIKEINFGLSKNFALTNLRTGIRFCKEYIDDSISATLSMGIFNKLSAVIGAELLDKFSHDEYMNKYIPLHNQVCAKLGLTVTNTVLFAGAPDDWIEFKRGDYVRVCIAKELSR